ncbi:DUF4269 domain-containing protein [Bacillus subtilis]|uniref:DUF4269 domain-containing protein n=1 Tax=Bacillus subtilis TaxID=1423 RepID=UPI0039793919
MFRTINYLKSGTETQRYAFEIINELNIFNDLAKYTPVLCGTVPIAIDVQDSDLDIIMEVQDFQLFKDEVKALYGILEGFVLTELTVRNIPTITLNFRYRGFDFELFAQPTAVEKQNAYRHMLIEHYLLLKNPQVRKEIIFLKKKGIKTETAFAIVFGLVGDPYDALLVLGTKLGVIL